MNNGAEVIPCLRVDLVPCFTSFSGAVSVRSRGDRERGTGSNTETRRHGTFSVSFALSAQVRALQHRLSRTGDRARMVAQPEV